MATVMGVLIVSFGIWGIADIFRGFGQSTLAKVGRTEISLNEFRGIYTDRLQQIGRGRHLAADRFRLQHRRGLVDHWLHPIREVYGDHKAELEAHLAQGPPDRGSAHQERFRSLPSGMRLRSKK